MRILASFSETPNTPSSPSAESKSLSTLQVCVLYNDEHSWSQLPTACTEKHVNTGSAGIRCRGGDIPKLLKSGRMELDIHRTHDTTQRGTSDRQNHHALDLHPDVGPYPSGGSGICAPCMFPPSLGLVDAADMVQDVPQSVISRCVSENY
jgi:hypothetical protein